MKALILLSILIPFTAAAKDPGLKKIELGGELLSRFSDGWDNGNAGDTFSAEFILTARDLAQRMKLLAQSELNGIDLNALTGATLGAKVSTAEHLYLHDQEVDAINYPDRQEIHVNRTRWRALRSASETTNRLMLVLHEYLFLVGVDDSQFRVSGRLVPQLGITDFNPNRWWNPVNPVNRVTLGLVYNVEGCSIDSLSLDLALPDETVVTESKGACADAFRRVTLIKSSYSAPPSSRLRGTFHRFELRVESQNGLLGTFTYEPEWGSCLTPQDGACRQSGKIFVGGVEFSFWMLR